MSAFGSLTVEQVYLKLLRERATYMNGYPALQRAIEGVATADEAESVREQHMGLVEQILDEMGVENADDPEFYGPILELGCDHFENLGKFIEETTE